MLEKIERLFTKVGEALRWWSGLPAERQVPVYTVAIAIFAVFWAARSSNAQMENCEGNVQYFKGALEKCEETRAEKDREYVQHLIEDNRQRREMDKLLDSLKKEAKKQQ